jgi:hypothetical protein
MLQHLKAGVFWVQDKNIDECGICGGLGSTCALILEIRITLAANASAATKV